MTPIFIQNEDGTFSQQVLTPFDPVATAAEIADLQAQMEGAGELASRNASAPFQAKIDALQALLDAASAQVPAVATLLAPTKEESAPVDLQAAS